MLGHGESWSGSNAEGGGKVAGLYAAHMTLAIKPPAAGLARALRQACLRQAVQLNSAAKGSTMTRLLLAAIALLLSAQIPQTQAAAADSCPGNADALGTARSLSVDAAALPRVGLKHFPQTLPLGRKEVVLTFDDGPWPGTTPRVLDALARECVKATFFLLGRNAAGNPALVRREAAEGHTIGYHTFGHPLLNRMSLSAAEAEIDRGFAAVDAALGDRAGAARLARFFRFPGFASSPALLQRLQQRGIAVFGADLWASDWNPMSPDQELRQVLSRLEAAGRGIVLFHDTKSQTAAMLPAFLWALKSRGYSIVKVVPSGKTPAVP
jgi:peptidoglycan/xylan/chitin deacetylase (PgdA/CDA1 family)